MIALPPDARDPAAEDDLTGPRAPIAPTKWIEPTVVAIAELPSDAAMMPPGSGPMPRNLKDEQLLKPFLEQAAAEGKNLFVRIPDQWDPLMRDFLSGNGDTGSIFNRYFVFCDFDGGEDCDSAVSLLRSKMGGNENEIGSQFYAILSPDGELLANSMLVVSYNLPPPLDTTRHTAGLSRLGICASHFLNVLDRCVPYLADEEWNVVHTTLIHDLDRLWLGPQVQGWTTPPLPLRDGSQISRKLLELMALAEAEQKNVFLLLGSENCGYCISLARLFDKRDIGPLLRRAFIVADFRFTPGVDDWFDLLSGSDRNWNAGVPMSLIVNPSGEVVVSSMMPPDVFRGQYNIGYPGTFAGINWFMKMLEVGAPALNRRRRNDIFNLLVKESAGEFEATERFHELPGDVRAKPGL